MENAYRIVGGKKLTGTLMLSGAKNVALKTIIASLLFEGKVVLENIPRINDVMELLHLVKNLGASVEFTENTVSIDATGMSQNKVDMLHGSKIRVSFMFFAPLLHRFKQCQVPNPGGCRIGARSIDRIIEGMQALGVEAVYDSKTGYYTAQLKAGIKGSYAFAKPTHTGTELLIMLSAIGTDTVTIQNAAFEPEIDELIEFLNQSGAKIVRHDSTITIEGVSALTQTKPFRISSDRNEAVTFAILGIASDGDVTIQDVPAKVLNTFFTMLDEAGAGYEKKDETTYRFFKKGPLKATNITTGPQPAFMTDWQPNWAILMTQAEGVSTIHETVFENRFAYVQELKKLGAKVRFVQPEVSDPASLYQFKYDPQKTYQQAIEIEGPTKLHNGVLSINDLRAGASLIIASLIADGESDVQGASIVERGYENLVEKITSIGGEIEKL